MEDTNLILAQSFLTKLKEDFNDYKRPYAVIAFRLKEAQEMNFAELLGYKDIYELAENEVGLKSTSTKNYLAYCEAYMDGTEVKERFQNYSFTALIEMLSIPASERLLITPSMTIKEIREWKQNHKLVEFANGLCKLYGELTDKEIAQYEKEVEQLKNKSGQSTDENIDIQSLIDFLNKGIKKYIKKESQDIYDFAYWLLSQLDIKPKCLDK